MSAEVIEIRTLGLAGPTVSRLGLGCVTFGREIDETAAFTLLDRAIEHGITLLDTAEAYGADSASERIVGRWMKSRSMRDAIVLETKLRPPLTPGRIADGIDAALRRLPTDRIDLMLFHAPDPATPLTDSLAAAADAIAAGKIGRIGCSNFSAAQITEAVALADQGFPALAVVQSNYNLAIRDAAALFPLCRLHGIGVQTYSPLAAGFLLGKYGPDRAAAPAGSRFAIAPAHADLYFSSGNFGQADRLGALAVQTGLTRTDLALAWVLTNAKIDNVLIGARTPAHVDAAIKASRIAFNPNWHAALDDSFATPGAAP